MRAALAEGSDACPAGDCALDHHVRVVRLQSDARAGSAEGLRRSGHDAFLVGKLVAQKKLVSVQNDLAVHEAGAFGLHHDVAFFAAKHFFVKLERGLAVTNDQMRNELIFLRQSHTPFSDYWRWMF